MTPERWQRLRAVFHQALEIPDSARAAFVSDACSGDAELGEEVASLFEAHRADSYLERPAAAELQFDSLSASSGPASADDGQVPDRIGPYTVTRLIARGGMGAVYLAVRDGDFHKQVAIKVIKRGMDSEAIVRRFRNERQILAHFDHPGIARLLDGGSTPGGQPYLVMEYIEGEAITAYSEARSLGVRARLGLFRAACEAVQYAHQNLVIHRDLKPGNILVTTSGRPKLLDFGIAKILNPDPTYEAAEQTMTVSRVLTPEYASPEQSRGGVVTTASDVYALGVLLFELLTGRRPYRLRTGSPEEVARAVCEQDVELASALVPPGSRLQRELRGDLDAIVAKALEKEPMRRYASASALSDDLGRYLEGKPVRLDEPRAPRGRSSSCGGTAWVSPLRRPSACRSVAAWSRRCGRHGSPAPSASARKSSASVRSGGSVMCASWPGRFCSSSTMPFRIWRVRFPPDGSSSSVASNTSKASGARRTAIRRCGSSWLAVTCGSAGRSVTATGRRTRAISQAPSRCIGGA